MIIFLIGAIICRKKTYLKYKNVYKKSEDWVDSYDKHNNWGPILSFPLIRPNPESRDFAGDT